MKRITQLWIMLISVIVLLSLGFSMGAPQGTQITSNVTEFAPVQPAGSSTTAGGSFTTMVLNTTTQTPRWKAYVGNVSGKFELADSTGSAIYDWSASSFTGEVFASRSNSVDWNSIRCSQNAIITAEENALNMTGTEADAIFNTFANTIHTDFYIGTDYFANSTCRAIATYINGASQTPDENADFQVVLLDDTSNLVFVALTENNQAGFDNGAYDFQLIVPESEVSSPHTYYFYTELG